jgi:prepilin-type N-terminal cleavage/methylation domain-containing protein
MKRPAFSIFESPAPRRRIPRRPAGRAFTLVELLVVVSIITILLAMLLPAMESAVAEAHKAKCAANQRTIAAGAVAYATQNSGDFFIARGRQVIHVFDGVSGQYSPHGNVPRYRRPDDHKVDWVKAMSTVGLAGDAGNETVTTDGGQVIPGLDTPLDPADTTRNYRFYKPLMMWICPTVNLFGYTEPVGGRGGFVIGYQYLGGIETWLNPDHPAPTGVESHSPVRLPTSRGGWVLTGDLLFKDRRASAASSWFQCHAAGLKNGRPPGGNYGHVDGSVAWADFYDTTYLHAWNTTNYAIFVAQKDLPFRPTSALDPRTYE